MKKLRVYKVFLVDGSVDTYEMYSPPTLQQLQSWVGGMIERAIVELPKRRCVYVNEEGLLLNLPINPVFPQFVGNVVDCIEGGEYD